jgi:transcriptional regulator with XRE-family HTH domain
MNVLGELLVRYREFARLTQKDLAEELSYWSEEFANLNSVTISRWETGATAPGLAKKRKLLKFLVRRGCLRADRCLDFFLERYQLLYESLGRLFTSRYQYIVGNYPDFGSDACRVTPILGHADWRRHVEHLIDIERVTNAEGYYTPTVETIRQWCAHPGSLGILCERKGQNLGHFLMIKLDDEAARQIAYHERLEFAIAPHELRGPHERGSYYIHALYGANPRVAAIVNVEAYLHMLRHFETIDNIVIFSSRRDGAEITRDYGIQLVAKGKDPRYGFTWHGMCAPVEEILFADNILRMIF